MPDLAKTLLLSVVSKMPKSIRDSVSMRIPNVKNDPSKVQLLRPSHVYIEHPDLAKYAEFAKDFGLIEVSRLGDIIYYRGYGRDPYCYVASKSRDGKPRFRGGAFVARTREDFDKAASLPGAIVRSLAKCPGGGEMVTFDRPEGCMFHVVYGQRERTLDPVEPSAITDELGPFNTPFSKPRSGTFQRFHRGPALVHKLGHFGYVVPKFDSELAWYTDNFNFVPSDVLHHWDLENVDIMAFMHLDHLDISGEGDEYSDHHSFFMQRAEPHVEKAFCHHTSFEVSDVDTQLIGHEWLASKGWHSIWGVGRHVQGSQIFDYWADPSGFKIEHYADGDLVSRNTPTNREVMGPFAIWGPEMPKDFGDRIPKAFLDEMKKSQAGSGSGGILARWWYGGAFAVVAILWSTLRFSENLSLPQYPIPLPR